MYAVRSKVREHWIPNLHVYSHAARPKWQEIKLQIKQSPFHGKHDASLSAYSASLATLLAVIGPSYGVMAYTVASDREVANSKWPSGAALGKVNPDGRCAKSM